MTASNPIHNDPTEIERRAAAHPPPRAALRAAPAPASDDPVAPEWVELAAGRAVLEEQARAAERARRIVELDAAGRTQDGATDTDALGGLYRTAYGVAMTIVIGFFASGAGLAIYVLLRH